MTMDYLTEKDFIWAGVLAFEYAIDDTLAFLQILNDHRSGA